MKQYTTPEQTAKLFELGFKPIARIKKVRTVHYRVVVDHDCNFNIGELLEMLPQEINNDTLPDMFGVYIDHNKMWTVDYSNILGALFSTYRTELIDALYDMVVKLKEGGVI